MNEECLHCGVIITKFKEQARPDRPPAPKAQFPSTPAREAVEPSPRFRAALNKRFGPSFEKAWRWLKGNLLGDEKVQQWSRRWGDAVSRCIVVFLVALTLEVGRLYLVRIVWFIYTSTSFGQVYLAKFGSDANGIVHLMQSDMAMVGWHRPFVE